jgi:uncharacterized RDD family membrane protein YckC
MDTPSFLRRLGALLYDGLSLIVLWLLASVIFTTLYGMADHGVPRLLLQLFCFMVVGGYFLWCWIHGGQTLSMQTWKIKLVYQNGDPLTLMGAVLRLLLATVCLSAGGLGVWWALLDRDGQFLHDRLAKTRLIVA